MKTKDRPILFSAPMVRALLDGSKTQTRRAVKFIDRLGRWDADGCYLVRPDTIAKATWNENRITCNIACPYGQPGDRLWVRETYFAFGRWETRYSYKKGRDSWHFVDMTLECGKAYAYAADGTPHDFKKGNQRSTITPGWWKRPAIFIPRAGGRIALDITGVRVERLQDISESDAIAEGLTPVQTDHMRKYAPEQTGYLGQRIGSCCEPRLAYRELWESINGTDSWAANPWVWVIEFKKASQ